MKIGLSQFSQETNTFSPTRYSFDDVCPEGFADPSKMIDLYRGTGTYLGGAIAAAEDLGIEVIPLNYVDLEAGPQMTKDCVDYILETICADIARHKDEMDGLFFAQHGAGCSEGYPCLEAHALMKIREVVGKMPIVSSLDMHCNLTPETLKYSDGLFPIKEFPHVDMAEAAYLAFTTLVRSLRGEIKPFMNWINLPQIYPNTVLCTLMSPMKDAKEYFAEFANQHKLLDASICQGFSAGDQYWSGSSVLVMSDGRPAIEETRFLAEYLWGRRNEFEPKRLNPEEAIREAMDGRKDGYVIINESTDNPGSGCPGDGTHLLRELVRQNIPGSLFMHIYDPETVRQAHNAGVGAKINIRLGGKTAPICGDSLELDDVEVINLSDGKIRFVSPMNYHLLFDWGLCCRLRYRNVDVVVTSTLHQSIDDRTLVTTGGDINDYSLICLKSAAHFRGYFQDKADKIVTCETPGLRSSDLSTYPYINIRRPIYPLEKEGEYSFTEVIKEFGNDEIEVWRKKKI